MASAETKAKRPDYIRKKLPSSKIQKAIRAIEQKLVQDEKETDPAKKLKVRELIGLGNTMASLGRLLSQTDKDAAADRKTKKTKSLYD